MAKLNGINLHIEKESESYKVDITEYAVEEGEPFSDHVSKRSPDFSISGSILSKNYETSKNKLISLMNAGKTMKYVGKMSASNVVITAISGGHTANLKSGMSIDISLRKIRVTKTAWQKAKPKDKPNQKPVTENGKKKPVTDKNAGAKKYHVTKSGDTYSGLAKKYGASVADLRKWNGYADTKIPIGAKLRVK